MMTSSNVSDLLKRMIEQPFQELQSFNPEVRSIDIVVDELRDWRSVNILQSVEYGELLNALKKGVKGPVLYWFEITGLNCGQDELFKMLVDYRGKEGRAVPALKKMQPEETRILYVGKVKKDFYGRVIQHLGYFTNTQTQGLQLYHWAQGVGLVLKLHYVQLPPSSAELAGFFELGLSRELKPLVGKHK